MEMDVNYLLHRQQVAMLRAQHSNSKQGQRAYEDLAREYSGRIEAYRQANERRTSAH